MYVPKPRTGNIDNDFDDAMRDISLETAPKKIFQLEESNSAPSKTQEWMIVAADGTNWNPGAGRGVYVYYSGAWNKLG